MILSEVKGKSEDEVSSVQPPASNLHPVSICYVGSNTGAPDGQSLSVLKCNVETGTARIIQTVNDVQGTTYFQLDKEQRHLYSGIGEQEDGKTVGTVVRFALDPDGRIGKMERLAKLPCETPCHVALADGGRRVAVAAYRSATAVTVGTDGKGLRFTTFPDDAMGPNAKRQQKAYAHQTFNLPDGKLGVVDLGCDRIRFFDPVTMERIAGMEIKADPGDGPRHAIWSRDGRFLFVVNELFSAVSSYAYDGAGFNRVCKVSMLPPDFNRWEADGLTLASKAAAIKLTDDGKILMASNRGHDSIAFFAVDAATGRLTLRNIAKLAGKFPRDFALMPGERFMVVGHKMSNEIQVYRFDRADCSLAPVGEPISAWRPLCFAFRAPVSGG